MTKDELSNVYFEWLFDLVCGHRYSKNVSYRKLLIHLHNTEFRYTIPLDENQAKEGMYLRDRFGQCEGYHNTDILDDPCSVLEMMVALSIHCEESIMDDPNIGNRTGQWFWGMIVNLGLGSMIDIHYDREYVEDVVECFLDRDYAPDGKGGLFRIKNCDCDLREMTIWSQMCWYLDNLL